MYVASVCKSVNGYKSVKLHKYKYQSTLDILLSRSNLATTIHELTRIRVLVE